MEKSQYQLRKYTNSKQSRTKRKYISITENTESKSTNYSSLLGKCKNCGGCMRLEDKEFKGTNECQYSDDIIKQSINKIKNILGIEEKN